MYHLLRKVWDHNVEIIALCCPRLYNSGSLSLFRRIMAHSERCLYPGWPLAGQSNRNLHDAVMFELGRPIVKRVLMHPARWPMKIDTTIPFTPTGGYSASRKWGSMEVNLRRHSWADIWIALLYQKKTHHTMTAVFRSTRTFEHSQQCILLHADLWCSLTNSRTRGFSWTDGSVWYVFSYSVPGTETQFSRI